MRWRNFLGYETGATSNLHLCEQFLLLSRQRNRVSRVRVKPLKEAGESNLPLHGSKPGLVTHFTRKIRTKKELSSY